MMHGNCTPMPLICLVCGGPVTEAGRLTCSKECHDKFANLLIFKYGEFKMVCRQRTGERFKVPLRDLIEKVVREQDLDKYPKWEDQNGV